MVALALALPWLVLRDAGPLMVPADKLDELTPLAQKIIREKQSHYRFVIDNYRYVSFLLGGVGVAVAVYGLMKWAERQKVANELEDTQRDTAKEQFRQLSPQEAEAKLARESEEVLASEAPEPSPEEPPTPPDVGEREREIDEIRENLKRVEERVSAALASAFSDTHEVRRNVTVRLADGSMVEADNVLFARSEGHLSLAVEVKYVRSSRLSAMKIRMIEGMTQASSAANEIIGTTLTGSAGLVLFVPEEPLPAASLASLDTWAVQIGERLTPPVAAVVIPRKEIETLPPDHLRIAVEAKFGGL